MREFVRRSEVKRPEDRFEAAERLGVETGASVAQILGRTVLLYRKHPDRPRFEQAAAPDPVGDS